MESQKRIETNTRYKREGEEGEEKCEVKQDWYPSGNGAGIVGGKREKAWGAKRSGLLPKRRGWSEKRI